MVIHGIREILVFFIYGFPRDCWCPHALSHPELSHFPPPLEGVQNGIKIDWDRESTGEPPKGSTQRERDSWVTGLTSGAVNKFFYNKWSICKMG